jgi:hypothetical protein
MGHDVLIPAQTDNAFVAEIAEHALPVVGTTIEHGDFLQSAQNSREPVRLAWPKTFKELGGFFSNNHIKLFACP